MKRRSANIIPSHCESQGSSGKSSPSTWPMYSLVSTVAIACYLNGLNGDFVHDDIPAVTMNKDVLALNPIGQVFKNDFWGTPMADISSHKSYRPLTTLTFRANYLCFGLQPVWFHVTNVALHLVACVLFTKVCSSVAGLKPPFATLGGLLFAAHPVHTEAVTGIVGRADVLACIFFLVSFLAYHGRYDGRCYIWTSVILGGLSMLAKETGITVFFVNIAYDLYKNWPNLRRTVTEVRWSKETQLFVKRACKMVTSFGLLIIIRLSLLQGSFPKFSEQDNPAAFHPSLYVRILTFCYLAAFNWWLLLCPATLSHDWQMGSIPLVTSLTDSRNIVTFLFLGVALLLATRSLIDFEVQRHVPLVLGCLLLIVPFMPATNLVVTVGFVVAERVLYIPSTGCILLTAYGLQLMWNAYNKYRQVIQCLIVLLLTTSCLRVVIRNKDWRSRESLLRAGLATLPHNAKMHYNFGNFLRDSDMHELAKTHYRAALTLWPTYASAHNNLGTLIERTEEAEQHFLLAIRYSSKHVNAHYNLGQLYRKSNRSYESEAMLKKCILLDPKFTAAYIELARLCGPNDPGVGTLLKRVVQINPNDPKYKTMYAHWHLGKRNRIQALKYYWKALAVSPTYTEAMMGAARVLRKFGDYGRLFQLVTRWQIVQRVSKGQTISRPHLYLYEWQLKNELSNKAKAYDNCPQSCIKPTYISKWNNISCNRTKHRYFPISRQCRLIKRIQKYRSTTPFMLHHILDTV
ncbi:protein O-mannosyl-transferase TMTC1-like [Onthophagus taurus]|uniref:protein O-mannosyl-transferase TMTC1-like n=1 Tax=Onthophagus taurus TaxID=166361 RepID=UPI000C208167|nr:transmembrane and TPR repeat-containing protein 1-like [Onthophagus taurus]XP_022919761.1 transmembrane and TPR repeat-containing protein 1-like [Onthophagus taurus]XP_022919762.1 transmembrane and TPR repeat-containing protein 1-like [Onthophagus taurus]